MSDYPFKVGDLVRLRWPYRNSPHIKEAVITGKRHVCAGKQTHSYYEVLCEGEVQEVMGRALEVPKIKSVSFNGQFKSKNNEKK
tara:strand:+ start:266 stop:517 length:252 start_codon:yes stop_codon:yes gene_type:complete